MTEINPLKSLKITSHYKYLLVLGGVILFWSIFNKVEILTQLKILFLSIITIIYGIICWMRETHINDKIEKINIEWYQECSKISPTQELINEDKNDKRKEFAEKKGLPNLLTNYHRNNWIIFIIWIICIYLTFIK